MPTSLASPVLHVGDTWSYQYSGSEGNSREEIIRSDTCGSTSCVVDQETNPAWSDTVWIDRNWNLSRELYVDHTVQYSSGSVYTPPLHMYEFPLSVGKTWWSNSTAAGWYIDQYGNHTQPGPSSFAIKRTVINQTTVTVPAGTFDTFLVAQYLNDGQQLNEYRWFSLQAETSVKFLIFATTTGSLFDSYVMTSYRLAPVLPILHITGVSPNPAKPSQTVRVDFTAIETVPDVSVTATWIDWGDNSTPDLILNMTDRSMCPDGYCTVPVGALILARGEDPSTIKAGPDCGVPAVGPSAPGGPLGSIIVLRPYPNYPDYLVAHRVRQIVPLPGNQLAFRTQGDNFNTNIACDTWPYPGGAVPSSQVVGVYQSTLSPSGPGERYDTHAYPDQGSTSSRSYTIMVNATDENDFHAQASISELISQNPSRSPTPPPPPSQSHPPVLPFTLFLGIAAAAIIAVTTAILLAIMTRKKSPTTLTPPIQANRICPSVTLS